MLKVLNWQTLENRNSLILLYKIKPNLVAVDHHHLSETKNLNFFIPYSRTRYHMNSYFPRTIRQWNSLPYSLKASSSLGEFTSGLATITFKSSHQFYVLTFSLSKCRSFRFMIIHFIYALTSPIFIIFIAVPDSASQ